MYVDSRSPRRSTVESTYVNLHVHDPDYKNMLSRNTYVDLKTRSLHVPVPVPLGRRMHDEEKGDVRGKAIRLQSRL